MGELSKNPSDLIAPEGLADALPVPKPEVKAELFAADAELTEMPRDTSGLSRKGETDYVPLDDVLDESPPDDDRKNEVTDEAPPAEAAEGKGAEQSDGKSSHKGNYKPPEPVPEMGGQPERKQEDEETVNPLLVLAQMGKQIADDLNRAGTTTQHAGRYVAEVGRAVQEERRRRTKGHTDNDETSVAQEDKPKKDAGPVSPKAEVSESSAITNEQPDEKDKPKPEAGKAGDGGGIKPPEDHATLGGEEGEDNNEPAKPQDTGEEADEIIADAADNLLTPEKEEIPDVTQKDELDLAANDDPNDFTADDEPEKTAEDAAEAEIINPFDTGYDPTAQPEITDDQEEDPAEAIWAALDHLAGTNENDPDRVERIEAAVDSLEVEALLHPFAPGESTRETDEETEDGPETTFFDHPITEAAASTTPQWMIDEVLRRAGLLREQREQSEDTSEAPQDLPEDNGEQ